MPVDCSSSLPSGFQEQLVSAQDKEFVGRLLNNYATYKRRDNFLAILVKADCTSFNS